MAEHDAVSIVRQNIEAFSAGDMKRFGDTLTDDNVYQELATQRRVQGRDEVVKLIQGWKDAFPDAKGTIRDIFASSEGNQVVVQISWSGTHQGDLMGPQGTIKASGKRVENVEACQVVTVQGGKIKEARHYFDLMTLLGQIGAIQAPTT